MSHATLEATAIARTAIEDHIIRELPVLVLMPHSRCNCRCVMCDIWRIRQVREMTLRPLTPSLATVRALGVRWVVFSGGEPLLHSDFWSLARLFRQEGIRTTVLTAGLTLERHCVQVAREIDDVIVSLDGPQDVHDRIRGIPGAYDRLERGIRALRAHRASMPVHGRCTVQKHNFRYLRLTVEAARELKLDSLSFLAADISSEAFNRVSPWSEDKKSEIALTAPELDLLMAEIEGLIAEYPHYLRSGFIRESPEKLRRIGEHFRAHLGLTAPKAPRCNAPWVSAVIESDGSVRPCFFHPAYGTIKDGSLLDVLNSDAAVQFRSRLDVANNPICQRCVCSLHLSSGSARPASSSVENEPLTSPGILAPP